MADIQPVQLIDEDGQTYTIYVETKVQSPQSGNPQRTLRDGDTTRETYDVLTPNAAKLHDIADFIQVRCSSSNM